MRLFVVLLFASGSQAFASCPESLRQIYEKSGKKKEDNLIEHLLEPRFEPKNLSLVAKDADSMVLKDAENRLYLVEPYVISGHSKGKKTPTTRTTLYAISNEWGDQAILTKSDAKKLGLQKFDNETPKGSDVIGNLRESRRLLNNPTIVDHVVKFVTNGTLQAGYTAIAPTYSHPKIAWTAIQFVRGKATGWQMIKTTAVENIRITAYTSLMVWLHNTAYSDAISMAEFEDENPLTDNEGILVVVDGHLNPRDNLFMYGILKADEYKKLYPKKKIIHVVVKNSAELATALATIREQTGKPLSEMIIHAHGDSGNISLSGDSNHFDQSSLLTQNNLKDIQLKDVFEKDAKIILKSCSVGGNTTTEQNGTKFMKALGEALLDKGGTVAASPRIVTADDYRELRAKFEVELNELLKERGFSLEEIRNSQSPNFLERWSKLQFDLPFDALVLHMQKWDRQSKMDEATKNPETKSVEVKIAPRN